MEPGGQAAGGCGEGCAARASSAGRSRPSGGARSPPAAVAVESTLSVVPCRRPHPGVQAVPFGAGAHAGGRPPFVLPDGEEVDCVVEVVDEKPLIFDGTLLVRGQHDGQVSGSSFEPGPWVWEEQAAVWRRDVHPHDVLVVSTT